MLERSLVATRQIFVENTWLYVYHSYERRRHIIKGAHMIIGVDVGNYDTKSQHTITPSGYKGPFSTLPPIADEWLSYNGGFYIPTTSRFPYEKDKTESERCVVLSLFAIAKEIIYKVKKERKDASSTEIQNHIKNIDHITLGVGLPPAHYTEARVSALTDYYMSHLAKMTKFSYSGYQFILRMTECFVYPQGGAGAVDKDNSFKSEYDSYFVVDIGGYTVDLLKFTNGRIDGVWASKEEGIITIFDEIIEKAKTEHDITLDYHAIESVLSGKKSILEISHPETVQCIREEAQTKVDHLIDSIHQSGVEFSIYPCAFMGGGSLLLKDNILNNSMINEKTVVFIQDPCANAKAYEVFAEAED